MTHFVYRNVQLPTDIGSPCCQPLVCIQHTMYEVVQSDQSPDFHSLSPYWLQVSKYFVGTAGGPNEFLKPFAQNVEY